MADNRALEGKTQRLCPSQALETLVEHMTNFQRKKCNVYIKKTNEVTFRNFNLPTNDAKYTKLYSCLLACFVGNMLLLKAA